MAGAKKKGMNINMELYRLTAAELSRMIRNKEVSSTEVTKSVFSRIKEKENEIEAYVTLNEEGYFLTTVPISMDWRWLLLLDGATFLVIVALMALPTMIISLILPEKTIRFE